MRRQQQTHLQQSCATARSISNGKMYTETKSHSSCHGGGSDSIAAAAAAICSFGTELTGELSAL